ncbi:MAG: autorepressor SdpR family transcription factor [Oscillospiraceae bacterium]
MGFGNTFGALSDKTRREILKLLKEKTLTAGEISSQFDTTPATISHHLSILKQADLISDTKVGKYIHYELNLSVFEEVVMWTNSFLKENNDEKEI